MAFIVPIGWISVILLRLSIKLSLYVATSREDSMPTYIFQAMLTDI